MWFLKEKNLKMPVSNGDFFWRRFVDEGNLLTEGKISLF